MAEVGARRVLVVEDDQDQREVVQSYLGRPELEFELRHADSLANAIVAVTTDEHDVILLDLNLPDSRGLATLDALREHTEVPIVVLTALTDTAIVREALQHGAQDYLPKDRSTARQLGRTLHYAIERRRLQLDVARAKDEARQLREAQALTAVDRPRLTVSAELSGERPLQQSDPATFQRLLESFRAIVQQARDTQRYRQTSADPRETLVSLSEQLGRMRAAPTDIVAIYRAAIAAAPPESHDSIDSAWREEARLMLIGLLGHVLAFYRLRAVVDRPDDRKPTT